MKNTVLTFILICLPFCLLSQNISGKWHGTTDAPEEKNKGYFDITINQKSNQISGNLYYKSYSGSYLNLAISGQVNNNRVTWRAQKIIEEYISPSDNSTFWCLRSVDAQLTNYANGVNSIEGVATTIEMLPIKGRSAYSSQPCPPSTFKVDKVLESPISVPTEISFSGQILDRQNLEAIKATLTIVSENTPKQTVSTLENGMFDLKVSSNSTYSILVSAIGYEPLRETMNFNKTNSTKNFLLSPTPRLTSAQHVESSTNVLEEKKSILLKNVTFELHTAKLLPQSFTELDRLVVQMHDNPKIRIRLEGHTDKILGSNSKLDLELSEERVKKVKEYLTSKGIKSTRIETIGYGQTKPIFPAPNDGNRRVEFVILNQ